MARNTEIQKYTTQKYQKFKKLTPFYPKRYGFVDSPRCTSLLGGFTLWEEYLDQAAKVLAQFDKSRVLTLRYEELLNNPGLKLSECAKFCGIACTDEKIDALIKNIDSSRAYSYLNFSVLSDFANDQQIALNKRGYK